MISPTLSLTARKGTGIRKEPDFFIRVYELPSLPSPCFTERRTTNWSFLHTTLDDKANVSRALAFIMKRALDRLQVPQSALSGTLNGAKSHGSRSRFKRDSSFANESWRSA
ncbi:hypothetical protein HNY73_019738 [Argiope bruennichi]|uniref:Uncharacterized protein n=1 Tax=Argiope bruennichi TaxID=94029 RepID=A0A8T0E8A4_ARGBR|nr:hypothetical protein HNY73_019738 [Argiope bruennichi]